MATPAAEDYLKAIYHLSNEGQAVSTSALAERLGIAAGSVTGMLKRLAEQGLVEHVPYYGARLSERGRREAVRTIRRHRVIELFLVEVLGYTWDRVHAEAERLEHAASEELIDRMAQVLGRPVEDPHGAPIPTAEGEIREGRLPTLLELAPGRRAILRRFADEDSAVLRLLGGLELVPGIEIELVAITNPDGPVTLRAGGVERVLARDLARNIRVEPVGD